MVLVREELVLLDLRPSVCVFVLSNKRAHTPMVHLLRDCLLTAVSFFDEFHTECGSGLWLSVDVALSSTHVLVF